MMDTAATELKPLIEKTWMLGDFGSIEFFFDGSMIVGMVMPNDPKIKFCIGSPQW